MKIILRTFGGFGNQLFQYFFSFNLASSKKINSIYSTHDKNYPHKFTLENSLDICYNYEKDCSYRISIEGNENINEILNSIHDRKNNVIFTILITQYAKNNYVKIISKDMKVFKIITKN